MKPFHTIAVPHRDILEAKLTMNVFAADLWETYLGKTFPEYKDPNLFFKKTYITEGLKNLLDVVENRLKGHGGDPVIQIQTPFGGGKTHALIALFHRAKQWGSKCVVLSGSSMSTSQTMWGEIEKQITGKTLAVALKGDVSPGKESLKKILKLKGPLLILVDELLEYATKAAGISVKDSTLAAQTIAFTQELTEVAGILDKICVVISLPSSVLEHYDTNAEKMFNQLQKVSGRLEKIYSPVRDSEISQVIRRRLFSNVDLKKCENNISEFLEYAEKEGILPVRMEVSEYKEKFIDFFPFLPDVI
jgi:predicted AAA+ superfamily ATPase